MIYPKFCGWNSGSSNSVSSQFKGLILADVRFCVAVLPATLPLKVMPAVVTRSVGWELTGQQHRDSLLPKRGSSMASSSQGRQCYGLFFPREAVLWPLLPKGGNAMASSSQGRQCYGLVFPREAMLWPLLPKGGDARTSRLLKGGNAGRNLIPVRN